MRALGVSSFVLGAGCVLLAARQPKQSRPAEAQPRDEVFIPVEVMAEPELEATEIDVVVLEPEELAELIAQALPSVPAPRCTQRPLVIPASVERSSQRPSPEPQASHGCP